jgi:hypothetical protein
MGEDVSTPLQIRNLTTEDNNYSVLRIYRGVRGGGANNNADYSGIDICEYDRNLHTDRNAERWFIYKNHTFNDVDSRNVQRIGPLQIGYIDKDIKPKTYGMSFYYNTENSNYHIDVNKNTVSYEDNKSAMSIYGDLDVHGNINIIDKYGSNYNFRLDNLHTLTQITQYITTVETSDSQESPLSEDSGQSSGNNDIRYTGFNILYTPNRSVIVDPVGKNAIPMIVKQDNSNLPVTKFITYADNKPKCYSSLELAIYNSNLSIANDDAEKDDNIKNIIKFNVSSDEDKHTNFDMSFYYEDYYKKFYNFKNNIDDSGNLIDSSTHIGIGDNIENSNVAFHIDDFNKYGLQITNNRHAPAINLLYTGATCNIYHTLSGSSSANKYRFSIDVANKSTFNEPESSNVFIIDAFDGNKLRKGARFGFNDDILEESFVIKTDYDTPAMAITSRYTSEYFFNSVVDIVPENLTFYTQSSNWNESSKKYSVTYNYDISHFPDIDNNLNPISHTNKSDPNFLFNSITLHSSDINYNTFHSNLNIDYNVSNLNVDIYSYKGTMIDLSETYPSADNEYITMCEINFKNEHFNCNISLLPQLSTGNNTITIDDSKSSIVIIEESFSHDLSLIDNVASNYNFKYNYSNVVFLPEYLNCNITILSSFNSNIVGDSNMIYVNNVIYTDIIPFDHDALFYQYMNKEVKTHGLRDNGIYTNLYLETTTSNIVRINSNISVTGKFTAEHQNTMIFMTSNILPDALINLNQEENYFEYTYNIEIEGGFSNVYINSSNFVVNNNVNSIARNMELFMINSDTFIEDNFEIYGNNFTNKIYLNEYFNKLSDFQDDNYIIKIKNYNYKNFKPHITLANDVERLDSISGHEIYSYDGVFEIKYVDTTNNDTWVPLKIDAEGNTYLTGGLSMDGDIRFDGKIYDANGNDLIEILNKNYYKEYEINSSNIYFNSLGSNGVEIRAYSSSNYDDYKFFYARDFLDDGITKDVMVLHKRLDQETQYKIDLYGDIDTSNGILRVEGRDVILDSCNYILDTSNVISNRISDLETDFISEEAHSSNRFIVDHNYDYNMSISGDLVVYSNLTIHSNLTVLGEFTTLNTEVYTTEQIDITNHGNDIALKIKQTEDCKIVGIFDDSSEVFTIAYSGNVGIHSDNPIVSLDINNTDAIHLPRGNVSDRPTQDKTGDNLTSLQGIIRFNNEYGQFEGFGSNNQWVVLGGIRDADRDTYIIAEQEAGSDDDYLLFVTAGSEKMVIKDDGKIGIGNSDPTYYLDVVGDIRAASNLYIGSNFGINNETPFVTMDVNTTDSIKIPKGDISQRPVDNDETDETHIGYIRYNTELHQFEGYGSNNKWGVLGGVRDTDRDTYIIAEDYAGSDNDELKFFTKGAERMVISSNGLIGIDIIEPIYKLDVDGDIRAAHNLYIGSNFGINNESPFVTMDINTTDSIKIPRGNTAERPVYGDEEDTDLSIHKGYIRYNTDLEQFEGFGAGNKWGSLGGIKDVDGDTYISAENSAGDDNDELKFFTSNFERMVISSNGLVGIGVPHPEHIIDIEGNGRISDSLYIGNKIGINNETPLVSLEINATDSIKIPVGTSDERPTEGLAEGANLSLHRGYIRFNSDLEQFEGFGAGNTWGSLGGIKDIDGDTYVTAENNAGDDNDELKFFTSNLERMVISSNGLVGIGTTSPDKNLTIYSENASFSIQDSRNGAESVSSIELVNGSNNDFDKNEHTYGWRISNSNEQFNIASGSNNIINDRFIIDGKTGNIGIGTKPHIYVHGTDIDEFKLNIEGSLNFSGDIYKEGTLFSGSGGGSSMGVVSKNMTVQTITETYTGTCVMSENDSQNHFSDNGWRFIDNDLISGFVIKIKPSHPRSKILLNLSCHIGFDSTLDSRWWGLKLYRKIEGSDTDWIEVNEANGNPASTEGSTACWLSHNLGANLSSYENFIANVSGSFCDTPDTRKEVYYTIKWKSKLGDISSLGNLYLNRPAKYNAAYTPVLSSSWVAQEIWQLSTPYIPASDSHIITLHEDNYVGIGNTEPGYKLDLIGNFRTAGDIFVDGKIGVNTYTPAFSLEINANDGLKLPVGNEGERPDSSTIVKGVIRYNTDSDQFEGYGAGDTWGSLGGVKDVDGDTYISAENNANDDNDELKFYTSNFERMVITSNGLVGVGNTEPNYKIDVNGEINASAFNINGTPFRLEFPSGMILQTKHLTFTDTCAKIDTDVDWVPVNNNLISGFVIRVKPTHSSSKILLNLICHIGMDYLQDSRWWGLKLYRKIGTGNWNEITGANGTGSDNGSSCWISHNLGAESSIYSHSITNVTGSYEDEPQTTEDVYYTIYWKSRLDGTNGRLYLNKSAESIDTNYPKPSSSWSASEIWNNGVPYMPPPASSVISLSNNNVGIGIVPAIDSSYKLNVNGDIKCHSLLTTSDKRYKKNILPLESTLQLIDSINPVSYTTLEERKRKYGFIAQDLEDIIPGIVNIPRDSKDLYSIDYISMIPLLTKSIQELSNIIKNQQKELNELKRKL